MKTKVCKKCGEEKPLDNFYRRTRQNLNDEKIYYANFCKECEKEYTIKYRYQKGLRTPYWKNIKSTDFLGIFVAERMLSKIFYNVKRMKNKNPGFDFICNKNYKIDVKSSCLYYPKKDKSKPIWHFHIKKNTKTDYFLCLGFDNRKNLNPKHIWLIPTEILKTKNTFAITNSKRSLQKWIKYELKDKLKEAINCCNKLKE